MSDDATAADFAEHMMNHINEGLDEWVTEHGKPSALWWVAFVNQLQEDAHDQL